MSTLPKSYKINKIVAIVFIILWSAIIFLDFGNKHPGYYPSFQHFRFTSLLLFLVAFIFGSWYLIKNKLLESRFFKLNGLVVIILIVFFFLVILIANKDFAVTDLSFGDLSKYFGFSVFSFLILCLFFAILRSLGRFIYRLFLIKKIYASASLELALGIIAFITVLFLIGVFGLLDVTSVFLLIFVSAVINISFLFSSIKDYLLKPINISDLSLLGYGSFILIVFFLTLNFMNTNIPYPTGFDSRNFYMNLAKLIAVNESLVKGYQPYNWTLLISVGFIIFDYVELALGISFFGIIISLIPIYELARKRFKYDLNHIFLVILLLVITPSIVNQMFIELKVDFGLLFFQLVTLNVFLDNFKRSTLKNKDHKSEVDVTQGMSLFVVLGLLCGFGLGIKLINLFMIFTIGILIWWDRNKIAGLFAALFLATAFIMVAGIDETSGLADSHLGLYFVKITCVVLGVVFIAYSFFKYKEYTINNTIKSLVFGLAIILTMLPWMAKNYHETKTLSVKSLILGDEPGPKLNAVTILQNYRKKKN